MTKRRVVWLYEGGFPTEIEGLLKDCRDHLIEAMPVSDGLVHLRRAGADVVVASLPIDGWQEEELTTTIRRLVPSAPVIFRDVDGANSDPARLSHLGARLWTGGEAGEDGFASLLRTCLAEHLAHFIYHPLGESVEPRHARPGFLVGESRAIQNVVRLVNLAGPRRSTVLITGESGTGKELAARALHEASPRKNFRMVAVNCSALPENLLESELFGHVKGAFTGAVATRAGRFEQAHNSTLFLDEVADMPMDLQAKLLRVLQEREFQRLGSSETIKVDVRIIAATNVDLLERVRAGRFREDLYYRLNVVPIRMPGLRERMSDVPLLASHFLEKVCTAEDLPPRTLGPGVLEALCSYSWPGNVRQLENAIEMAVVLSGDRRTLQFADFEAAISAKSGLTLVANLPCQNENEFVSDEEEDSLDILSEKIEFEEAVRRFERSLIERAISEAKGNKSRAARILGLKRTTLVCKLKVLDGVGASYAAATA